MTVDSEGCWPFFKIGKRMILVHLSASWPWSRRESSPPKRPPSGIGPVGFDRSEMSGDPSQRGDAASSARFADEQDFDRAGIPRNGTVQDGHDRGDGFAAAVEVAWLPASEGP